MTDTSKFKTAHALAKELLAGPDLIVVMPIPAYDMPNCYTAFPVRIEQTEIEKVPVITVMADAEALQPESEPESKPSDEHRPTVSGQESKSTG